MATSNSNRVWTVADAQANLPEVLRLAETDGPQYIGTGKTFVVTPVESAQQWAEPRKPLGQWLVENMPRGTNLEIPKDRSSKRAIPFIEEGDE